MVPTHETRVSFSQPHASLLCVATSLRRESYISRATVAFTEPVALYGRSGLLSDDGVYQDLVVGLRIIEIQAEPWTVPLRRFGKPHHQPCAR